MSTNIILPANTPEEQAAAKAAMKANPWNIGVRFKGPHMLLIQVDQGIVLDDPKHARDLGHMLLHLADQWEKGEIP